MTATSMPTATVVSPLACPVIEPATAVGFAELFSFIDRAGGIPSGVTAGSLQYSFERLGEAPPTLCRSIIVRERRDIVAHCCIMKRYTHTWTIQHITSTKGDGQTGLAMSRAALELIAQDSQMEFVHANYAISNPFSSRTIGSALPGVEGTKHWALAHRVYAAIDGVPAAAPCRAIAVRTPCTFADFRAAERIIAESESPVLMAANDWQATTLPMRPLEVAYGQQGLLRRRHLLIAQADGKVVGFALAEVSSVGMNVREDFSAGRLWVSNDAGLASSAVRCALLQALAEIYAAYGRSAWHLVADRDQESFLASVCGQTPVRFVEAVAGRDALADLSAIWSQMARTAASSRPAQSSLAA